MTKRLLPLVLLTLLAACGAAPSRSVEMDAGVKVGRAALDSGSPEMALKVAGNVLAASPGNTAALLLRADALAALGRTDEAVPIFRQVLAADPGSIGARMGLGRALIGSDAPAAERLFAEVLKADPRNAAAANNLGIARDLQDRHADAQVAYRQALASQPAMQAAAVNLALSLGMSGRGSEALPLLRPIAQAPGASPKVRHDLAAVLAMSGQREEAAQMLAPDLADAEIKKVIDAFSALRKPGARP